MVGKIADIPTASSVLDTATSGTDLFDETLVKLRKKRNAAGAEDEKCRECIPDFIVLLNNIARHQPGSRRGGVDNRSIQAHRGRLVNVSLSADVPGMTGDKSTSNSARQPVREVAFIPAGDRLPQEGAPRLLSQVTTVPPTLPGTRELASTKTDTIKLDKTAAASSELPITATLSILPHRLSQNSTSISDAKTPHRHEHQHSAVASMAQRLRQSNLGQGTSTTTHAVHFDFPFQRWSGNHSVHVALQPDHLHDGSLILHPSDTRAAEALQRQIEHLPKFDPDIHFLGGNDQEREGQRQHQDQEEDEA